MNEIRSYNSFQQLVTEYQQHGAAVNTSTSPRVGYSYADGSVNTIRRTGVTYPDGRPLEYHYSSGADDKLSRTSSIFSDLSLTNDLVSYWKLEEASGTRADVNNANNLADRNSNTTRAAGKLGFAAQFLAANSNQLWVSGGGTLGFGKEDFTTSGWIKFDDVSVSKGMWGKGNSGNTALTQAEWMLYKDANGKIYWVLSNGTASVQLDSGVTPTTGTWYFIVAWYSATDEKAYIQINGAAEVSTPYTAGPSDRGLEFSMGRTCDRFFSGLIDSVGVWNRVLTDRERRRCTAATAAWNTRSTSRSSITPIWAWAASCALPMLNPVCVGI